MVPPPLSSEGRWLEYRSPHFSIFYRPGGEKIALKVAEEGEKHLPRLAQWFSLPLYPPLRVVVYPRYIDFVTDTGADKEDWIVGFASSRGYIAMDGSGYLIASDRLLAHEIVHILLFRRLRNHLPKIPLWLNEGLAEVLSGEAPDTDSQLIQAGYLGRLAPFEALEKSFPRGEEGSLAYAQSRSFVAFLRKGYGDQALQRVVLLMAQGTPFPTALRQSFGVSLSLLEKQWREDLLRPHWWWTPAFADTLILILMFGGLIFAYRSLLQRRKRLFEEEGEAGEGFVEEEKGDMLKEGEKREK